KEPGCREHGEPFLEQVELQLLVGEPKLLNGDVGANERNDHGRECPEDVQPPWCAVEPPRGHRARGVARRRDDSTCGRRPPWAEYGGPAARADGDGGSPARARPRREDAMVAFPKLTYERLQVGEEFVSDTFLVTPEEIETYAFAVDDHHPWFFEDSPFG